MPLSPSHWSERATSSLSCLSLIGAVLLGVLAFVPSFAAAVPSWAPFTLDGQRPRNSHGMCYDANRSLVVAFGGLVSSAPDATTLEWSGSRWEQVAVSGPSARTLPSMVYFPKLKKVVLFGGWDNTTTAYDDTWTYDGQAWTKLLPATSPSPRAGGSLVYDPQNDRLVLIGGQTSPPSGSTLPNYLNDMWSFDGTTWTQLADAPFSGRSNAAVAYDQNTNLILIAGGATSIFGWTQESYLWDGTTWLGGTPNMPAAPSSGSKAYYDPVKKGIVFLNGARQGWLWGGGVWNDANMALASAPEARNEFGMAYNTAQDKLVIFGGTQLFNEMSDTWVYERSGWKPFSNGDPRFLLRHTMCWDPVHERMLMVGTSDNVNTQTWEWDQGGVRRLPGVIPGPVTGHGMAYDSARDIFVLYREYNTGLTVDGELWEYNGGVWEKKHVSGDIAGPGPGARQYVSMAYDARRAVTVLVGGANSTSVWEWNGSNWNEVNTTHPGQRRGAAMVYDSKREKIVLFGGRSNGVEQNDTWEYDGQLWNRLPATGPQARWYHSMAYDPDREVVIVYGGSQGFSFFSDTWEFNGTAWSQNSTSVGPQNLLNMLGTMEYNPVAGLAYFYTGLQFASSEPTLWTYGEHPPTPTPTPSATPTPSPTPTQVPSSVGITLWGEYVTSIPEMRVDCRVYNTTTTNYPVTVYIAVEVLGNFYFYPTFSTDAVALVSFDLEAGLDTGRFRLITLPFPSGQSFGNLQVTWYGALINSTSGSLVGNLASAPIVLP